MATFNGTQGNDSISGTVDNDTINGLGGADFLAGNCGPGPEFNCQPHWI